MVWYGCSIASFFKRHVKADCQARRQAKHWSVGGNNGRHFGRSQIWFWMLRTCRYYCTWKLWGPGASLELPKRDAIWYTKGMNLCDCTCNSKPRLLWNIAKIFHAVPKKINSITWYHINMTVLGTLNPEQSHWLHHVRGKKMHTLLTVSSIASTTFWFENRLNHRDTSLNTWKSWHKETTMFHTVHNLTHISATTLNPLSPESRTFC